MKNHSGYCLIGQCRTWSYWYSTGLLNHGRAVTKFPSCLAYTTYRRKTEHLGSFLSSTFLVFALKVARCHAHGSQGKFPAHGLRDSPAMVSQLQKVLQIIRAAILNNSTTTCIIIYCGSAIVHLRTQS